LDIGGDRGGSQSCPGQCSQRIGSKSATSPRQAIILQETGLVGYTHQRSSSIKKVHKQKSEDNGEKTHIQCPEKIHLQKGRRQARRSGKEGGWSLHHSTDHPDRSGSDHPNKDGSFRLTNHQEQSENQSE